MKIIRKHALLTSGLLLAATATGANAATLPPTSCAVDIPSGKRVCELYAAAGTTSLPDGAAVTIWGYAETATAPAAPGGPALIVNQGEIVVVNLHNNLAEATGLLFQGQDMVPDAVGTPGGGSKAYEFVAARPGTYLYEAGLLPNAQHQAAMGLYGALVVRPATAGQAYDGPATGYDDEALLVLGEIDPALAASPATFDMRNYAPQYFVINGKAYPQTDEILTAAGRRVLLRYVNAGILQHSMALLGTSQAIVGKDGSPLAHVGRRAAETVAPGETLDAIATVPAAAADGSRFALYDGSLKLYNGTGDIGATRFGGMLTFLRATAAAGGDTAGPVASGILLSPNPTTGLVDVALTASVSDAATGGANVQAAEYRLDSTASVAMAPSDGAFDSPTEAVQATIGAAALAGLPPGGHIVYVRGQDALGNWGPFASAVLDISDGSGPATTALVLVPNPSNGSQDVALGATADDSATGNASIAAAEYWIDAGAASPMAVNLSSPVASVTATVPAATVAALAEGTHVVSARSQDALGNWGAPGTASLQVDRTGPATSGVVAAPNPLNGASGVNQSTPAVRVTATAADPLAGGVQSRVAAMEGFIDTVGASGSGFPLVPSDGLFDAFAETAYGDIPLTTIALLSAGNHSIHVHGRDAAGNWGATGSVAILIDRTAPTLGGITVAPNPAFSPNPATLTVSGAADPLVGGLASGVTGGEWWLGTTNPAPGGGTAFGGTTATIPTAAIAAGTYTVRARIRDAAGNWSAFAGTSLTVAPEAIFADGFESPNTLPGNWTSRSTTSATRLSVTGAAAMVGSWGLQAQGNNTNYVQHNFGSAANPAWPTYDARFYFRVPAGASSTGKDILAASASATGAGFNPARLFRVRYRVSAGQPQVQIQVGTTNPNTAWTNVAFGAANVIEVVWQAAGSAGPAPGTLQLHVNGALAQTLGTTSTGSVTAVRMGSVTATGNATALHFDAFASRRSVTSLIGP